MTAVDENDWTEGETRYSGRARKFHSVCSRRKTVWRGAVETRLRVQCDKERVREEEESFCGVALFTLFSSEKRAPRAPSPSFILRECWAMPPRAIFECSRG